MSHSQVSLTKQLPPWTDRSGKATRHLCAGVYLDRNFRDMVIRQVHNDPHRRAAPCYGFDLVAVVEHAWRAWTLETAQHVCVLAVFVIGYASNAAAAITAASGIGLWYLVPYVLRTAPKVLRLKAKTTTDRWLGRHGIWRKVGRLQETDQLEQQSRLLRISLGGCAVLLALPVVTAGAGHIPLREVTTLAAFLMLLITGVVVTMGAVRQRALNEVHKARVLRPTTLTRRQSIIDDQQSDALVVYRRPEPKDETDERPTFPDPDHEPNFFVGSGRLVHRWLPPMAIQLLRPGEEGMTRREYVTPPFKAHELVDHLKRVMTPVGHTADPIRLPGFHVKDRVYVAETDTLTDPECLRVESGRKDLKKIINDPHGSAHHFLEIGVTSSGELVTTVFLRVTVKGRSLSLDFAACALTRTPVDYQLFDASAEGGKGATLRSALRVLRDLPGEVGQLWRLGGAPVVLTRGIRARKHHTPVPPHRVAMGTQPSIREEKSTPWKEAEFDEPTILDQMKIIELRLLKATEDFLKSKKVDTSVFKKRAETIISASVLNMGGRVDINNSAIGNNAQVNHGVAGANGAVVVTSTEGAQS